MQRLCVGVVALGARVTLRRVRFTRAHSGCGSQDADVQPKLRLPVVLCCVQLCGVGLGRV